MRTNDGGVKVITFFINLKLCTHVNKKKRLVEMLGEDRDSNYARRN